MSNWPTWCTYEGDAVWIVSWRFRDVIYGSGQGRDAVGPVTVRFPKRWELL